MKRFIALSHFCCERINRYFLTLLEETPKCALRDAISYSILNGGKRLRPMIVYATGELLGAAPEALDIPAAAIECMHCFSLIHDDLPAMDNSALRRGKPSCHKAFDEATAILAGDALHTACFEILSTPSPLLSPAQQVEMINVLAQAAGSSGMAYGQMLDINQKTLTLDQLNLLHHEKTGKILEACVRLAIITSRCKDDHKISCLMNYVRNIGLAFQISDDILDVEGKTEHLGKPTGSDDKLNKMTYPKLLGLDASKKVLHDLYEKALLALREFSPKHAALEDIAHFIIQRNY